MPSTFEPYFENNPTLKLLRGNHAGFILGFFHDSFKESGQTQIPEEDLEAMLDQQLQEMRRQDPETSTNIEARVYLNRWCEDGYRLLQKRFSEEKSSYVYQLTQHSEKAFNLTGFYYDIKGRETTNRNASNKTIGLRGNAEGVDRRI